MCLSLGNALGSTISTEVKFNKAAIDVNGKSLSTGAKADADVVSDFLGKSLSDKAFLQQKILKNISYSSNALKLAESSISSISSTITDMLAIVAQAESCSDGNRVVLNDMLQQKINQVAKVTTSAVFDGRQLLVGDFGSNYSVRTNYNTKTVDVRRQGVGAGGNFAGVGAKDQKILDFSNPALFANLKVGDTMMLRGVKFTFVEGAAQNENEVTLGKSPAEMASNLTTAIRSNSSEALRAYNVTARNGQTIIVQRSASSAPIPLTVPASIDASSTPSTISFEFYNGNGLGSSITLANETFTFVNTITGPNQVLARSASNVDNALRAKDLAAAMQANLNIKALIDQGFLAISASDSRVVTIRSTLSEKNLGFATTGNLGLYNNLISKSKATVYAKTYTIKNAPNAGDKINVGIGTQLVQFDAPTLGNIMTELNDPIIKANPNGWITSGALSLSMDIPANKLTFYSDVDLGLQYVDAANLVPLNAGEFKNAAISTADTSVLRAAVDVSEIRDIEVFIGTPEAHFEVISEATSAVGDGAAAALYQQVTGQVPPTASADGDSFAVIEAKVAGRTFQALVWKEAAAANIDSRGIVFKEAGTGEVFTVNTGTNNYNPTMTVLAEDIKTLFSTTMFAQTRDLEIFKAGGQIIDETATVIGDVTGMTVSLNSTDFNSKSFQDFKITEAPGGGVTFTATINGQKFSTSLAVSELAEGAALKLTNPDNSDVLVINVGKGGLNSLGNAKNYGIIEHAMKKALLSIGIGLDVKIGIEAKEKVVVQIDDITTNKLYRDNKGTYIQGINLLTKHSIKVAQEVLTNALKLARGAEAKIIANNMAIATYAEALSNTRDITQESSASYVNTDLIKSATSFSEAVKHLVGSISALEAGNKVSDAAERVITSIAAAPAA
jgi:hypothetical protein